MEDRFKFRFLVTYFDDDANEKRTVMQYSDNLDSEVSGSYLFYCDEDVIIQQCTGLKDKNGKLIYEGDILKFADTNAEFEREDCAIDVVKWGGEDYPAFDLTKYAYEWECNAMAELQSNYIFEVIGNIYENKDLLNA